MGRDLQLVLPVVFIFLGCLEYDHLTTAEYHCSEGWRINHEMCYYINTVEKVTWRQAFDICTALNASLVTVPNQDVNNFIVGEIETNVWLGLHDFLADNHFTWVNQSAELNYTRWAEGEPNNAAENCVCLYALYNKGSWNDVFCRKKLNYICERSADAGSCPQGWEQNEGSCYHFSRSKLIWTDAERECRRLKSHLVVIKSEAENDFIKDRMPIADHWIGLSDVNHEGRFTWVGGNVSPVYANWHSGEPNNGNNGLEDCVNMNVQFYRKGKWNTDGCAEVYGYICEKSRKSNETNCTANWTGRGLSCYLVQKQLSSWYEASNRCQEMDADLVVIDDEEEQRFLDGHPDVISVKFWIGLNDLKVRDRWSWLDRETVLSGFTNWSPSEPSTSAERSDCVLTHSTSTNLGLWANAGCSHTLGYICELDTEACVSSAWVVFNGHCYHFNFTPTSWPDAQRRCVNLTSEGKAYLVQISGSQEQNFINDHIRGHQEVAGLWLGLNSRRQTGSFIWIDNSEPSWANWDARQPTLVTDEKCVEIQVTVWKNKGRWNDVNCLDLSGFICQKPATGDSSFYDFTYGDSVYKVAWHRFSQMEGGAFCRQQLGLNASLWQVDSMAELMAVGRELQNRVTGTGQQYWVKGDATDTGIFTYWGQGRPRIPEPGRRCLMVSKETVYSFPVYRRPYSVPSTTSPAGFLPKYIMSARSCCEEKMVVCEKTIDRTNQKHDFEYGGSMYKLITASSRPYHLAQMSCGFLLGGTLAVLETLEERVAVSAELKARHLGHGLQYWLGGDPARQLRLAAENRNTSAAQTWLNQLAVEPAPGEHCAMMSHAGFPHIHWSEEALDMVPTTCTGKRRYICERHLQDDAPSRMSSGATLTGTTVLPESTTAPPGVMHMTLMRYNCFGPCKVLAVTFPFAILATVALTLACMCLYQRGRKKRPKYDKIRKTSGLELVMLDDGCSRT